MILLLLADARAVHTERYKTALEKQGVTVVLASMEHTGYEDIPINCPTGIQGVDYRLAARKIKEIVERENPDIVDAHSASGYGYAAAVGGLSENCPLAVHCLGSDILISAKKSAFHKKRIQTALSGASIVFVDSEYLRSEAEAIYPNADYEVIYWGAEKRIFELYYHNYGVSANDNAEPIKALVPRPHERVYNNRYIIEALADYINNKYLDLYFPDWGSGIEEFRKYTEIECPSGRINYYSRMIRDDYIEFVDSFDMYISASLSDSSPASLIEAMAVGLVPLVGDIPGVAELMKNSPELLYDLKKPKSLRDLFESILDLRLDFKSMCQSNHTMIREIGCFEDNIDSTIQIMQSLIDNNA